MVRPKSVLPKNNVLVNVKLPEEIVDKVDELVKKHDFDTRSSFVRKAVVEYLRRYEERTIVS